MRRIILPKPCNPGTRKALEPEKILDGIEFNVHKFNNRPRPKNNKRIVIFSMFGEFGCETLGFLYCIPRILQQVNGYYTVAMGWYGRQHLYKHLVDEYWEIKEDYQWLREYARAFHNDSKNLKKLEKIVIKDCAQLYGSPHFAQMSVGNKCLRCNHVWADLHHRLIDKCPKCGAPPENLEIALLGDVKKWKQKITPIARPSEKKIVQAWQYLKPNSVGIFARGRECYGRNLQSEFYVKLIKLLEGMGYNPIWLGEKATTLPCPAEHIFDFSRVPEARDLEITLAIISELKFTIQFWTASTRLAGMMGVPYLLFESPDQIWGSGQEGLRRQLCDLGPSKLAACHYLSVYRDNDAGIDVVKRCIQEMEKKNYDDVLGVLESAEVVASMKNNQMQMQIGI